MRVFYFIFIFFLSNLANASYLQMIGFPNLQVRETKTGLLLSGTFGITNQGDELAKNVFPRIRIDNFSLSLNSQMILAGKQYVWEIKTEIPDSKLCLKVSSQCPVALSKNGDIAVRVDKQYQDANSYQFSAPEVLILSTNPAVRGPIQSSGYGMLIVTTENQGKGLFKVEYDLKNMTDDMMEAQIQAVLPEQMQLVTTLPVLKIGPKAGLLTHFIFRNDKALEGSTYQIPVVATWLDGAGARRSLSQIGGIKVASGEAVKPSSFSQTMQKIYEGFEALKTDRIFWVFWAGIFALLFLGMYFFWIKPFKALK